MVENINNQSYSIKDKIYVKLLVIFSFFGVLDTFYLAKSKFTSSELYCGVLSGCNKVAASEYSSVFGIPLAYLGLFFYLLIFSFVSYLLYLVVVKNKNLSDYLPALLFRIVFLLTTASSLASVYFLYIQIFKIKYICIYCVFSAFLSFLMFFVSLLLLKNKYSHKSFSHENNNKDS